MRIFKIATIFALACLEASQASAESPQVRGIAGSWVLQSIYEEDDTGQDLDQWGERPAGHFIADAAGHFSFQLVGRGAIRFASASSAPVCSALSDREALAYAGTYVLDAEQSSITLQIEDATIAQWDKSHPKASIIIRAYTLDFISSAETSPTGAFYTHLVWKRVN